MSQPLKPSDPSKPDPSSKDTVQELGLTVSTPKGGVATPRSPGARRGSTAEPSLIPGDVLGDRYRIVRFIGKGGMGEVYEAEDLALRGRVALKSILPEIAADPRALERFKREIQLARQVTHPNVCRIYDLGTHNPVSSPAAPEGPSPLVFLTMEMLDGETLSQRISRLGRLDVATSLALVEQMAAGLDAAHAVGIIHRDFKSSNVMLAPVAPSRGGLRAVVTDFGLARPAERHDSVVSISDTGVVLGTPAYMAPEQVLGKDLTPAADIYALGIIMYEMVTGVRPFDGGSAMSVAVRRLNEPPLPPRERVPELDVRWETVILRCLERDPAARYASAADVTRALCGEAVPQAVVTSPVTATVFAGPPEPSAPGVSTPGGRARPGRFKRSAVLAGVTAGLLALGWAGAALWRARPAGSPAAGAAAEAPSLRRSVAVWGFRNVSGQADVDWISTAIAEVLTTELATGGELRVLAGAQAVQARRDLALAEGADLTVDDLRRVRSALGVDLLAVGSYSLLGGKGGVLRLDLRLEDTQSGEVQVTAAATGTDAQLFDLVSRAAVALRHDLGLRELSPSEVVEAQRSLPEDREAAQAYSEGLARLRIGDALAARDLLKKAIAAESGPLPQAALAEAWNELGYEDKAVEAARKAVALAGDLPPRERQLVEARLHQVTRDWPRAIEAYAALFDATPDDVDVGVRLAEAQLTAGQVREALVTVEKLRRLPPQVSNDPRIDLAAARAHYLTGEYEAALGEAERAAKSASASGARLMLARTRIFEAALYGWRGDDARERASAEEARALYEEAGHRKGLAEALEYMGISVFEDGDLDGAERLFDKALAIHRETGERRGEARVLHNLGNLRRVQGRPAESAALFEQALALFDEIGAKSYAAQLIAALGANAFIGGDLAEAQRQYQRALDRFSALGDNAGIAESLTNLGEVFFLRGSLDEARQMHSEALAINREAGARAGEAYDTFRLGEVFGAQGDLRMARERLDSALSLQEELKDSIGAATTRVSLAWLSLAEGRAGEAEELARNAEEVVRVEGARDVQGLALAALGHALLGQAKDSEARETSRRLTGLAETSEDFRVRLWASILEARVAPPGQTQAALDTLQEAAKRAAKAQAVAFELEARLAAGELEMRADRTVAGKRDLASVAEAARRLGLGLIGRRADALMAQSG